MSYSNRRILVCISKVILIITSIICTSLFILSVHNIATGVDKQPEGIVIQYDGYLSPHNYWEYTSHVKAYKEAFKAHRGSVNGYKGSHRDCSTDEECSLLAKLILYEARSESEHCQHVVASVVINRVNDSRWGDSVEEVIKQPKQFSFLQDWHKQTPPTKESEEIANNIAKKVLDGDTKGDYLWYHANSVKPKWSINKKGVVICNQTFYNTL